MSGREKGDEEIERLWLILFILSAIMLSVGLWMTVGLGKALVIVGGILFAATVVSTPFLF